MGVSQGKADGTFRKASTRAKGTHGLRYNWLTRKREAPYLPAKE